MSNSQAQKPTTPAVARFRSDARVNAVASGTIDFQRLKDIGQQQKDAVAGYLRENAQLNIPPLVANLCLLFWFDVRDEFDDELKGEDMVLTNEKRRVHRAIQSGWDTLYGKKLIPSTMNGTYSWRYRIIGSYVGDTFIGIGETQRDMLNRLVRGTSRHYVFHGTYLI